MNHKQVVQLLSVITDLYPSTRFSETADENWLKVLGPYPAEAVVRIFDRLCRQSPTFAPTAYQIAAELDATGGTGPSPDELWGAIQNALRGHNPDHKTAGLRKIREIDELAGDVIEHGLTWETVAWASIEDRRFLFGRFKDALIEKRLERDRAAIRAELPEIEAGRDPWPGPLPMARSQSNGLTPIGAFLPKGGDAGT